MVFQCNYFYLNDENSFYGLCFTLGQMSFLGFTVITSLVTAVPITGQSLVEWLWVDLL